MLELHEGPQLVHLSSRAKRLRTNKLFKAIQTERRLEVVSVCDSGIDDDLLGSAFCRWLFAPFMSKLRVFELVICFFISKFSRFVLAHV